MKKSTKRSSLTTIGKFPSQGFIISGRKKLADDLVNHPCHYKSVSGLESIEVIEAFGLNFNLGNVIKYILRCEKKEATPIQDLKKAKWYLEREIAKIEKGI